MKIIIAGYGFVGKAVANSLKDVHELYIVDPAYNSNRIEQYSHADCMIVCVGTPSAQDGNCDVSQVESVLYNAPYGMPILIKCTIPPDYLEKLITEYPNNDISYSPEFLRAVSADEDFKNQTYMVLGGNSANYQFWREVFEDALPKCEAYLNTTVSEASMIKYATNCFLSAKVTFFNQLYDICQAGEIDYDTVRQVLSYDHRIGASHMQVPGPDGSRGYGGACFPKDTNAFVHYSDRLNTKVDTLESAIKYNKKIRKSLT
jgi:UDPglucose 6-dehydrogenase